MMKLVLILFTLTFSSLSQAFWYAGAGIGYTRYNPEALKKRDQVASGARYGIVGGYNFAPMPVALEGFYNYTNAKSNTIQYADDRTEDFSWKYIAKIQSMGVAGKYYFGDFHIRVGYAYHKLNTYILNTRTQQETTLPYIKETLGSKGKQNFHGWLFGAGLDFPLPIVVPYVTVTSYQFSNSNEDLFDLELGLKFKF